MLKIVVVKSLIKGLIFVNKNNSINKVSSGISKINRAKFKNIIIPDFLNKF